MEEKLKSNGKANEHIYDFSSIPELEPGRYSGEKLPGRFGQIFDDYMVLYNYSENDEKHIPIAKVAWESVDIERYINCKGIIPEVTLLRLKDRFCPDLPFKRYTNLSKEYIETVLPTLTYGMMRLSRINSLDEEFILKHLDELHLPSVLLNRSAELTEDFIIKHIADRVESKYIPVWRFSDEKLKEYINHFDLERVIKKRPSILEDDDFYNKVKDSIDMRKLILYFADKCKEVVYNESI